MQDGSEAEPAGASIVDSSSQNTGAGICSGDAKAEADGGIRGAEGAEDQADSAECEAPPSAELQPAASCGEDGPATLAMADSASAGTEVCDRMHHWLDMMRVDGLAQS